MTDNTLTITTDEGTEEIPIENAQISITDNTGTYTYRCRVCGTQYDGRQPCTHCIAENSVESIRVL